MSEKTGIEWADSTGNPWIGCTKVSPGCANCYAAELDAQRFSRTLGGGTKEKPISHWGKGAPRFRTKAFWQDAVKWNRLFALGKCALCGRPAPIVDRPCECGVAGMWDRPRVFPSLCDWLDDEVPIEWLADFLKLIHDTPNLDWLLLTKRPENFANRLIVARDYLGRTQPDPGSRVSEWVRQWVFKDNHPANIWLGTSVEDQQRADERIPELLKIPAKIRFLSVEPLLGPINLRLDDAWIQITKSPFWIIAGGESGTHARPCHVDWIRSIVQQCKATGVSCFVKQLGADVRHDTEGEIVPLSGPLTGKANIKIDNCPLYLKDKKGGDMAEWPSDLRVRQFPNA